MSPIARRNIVTSLTNYANDGIIDATDLNQLKNDFATVNISSNELEQLSDILQSSVFEGVNTRQELQLFLEKKAENSDGQGILDTIFAGMNSDGLSDENSVAVAVNHLNAEEEGYTRISENRSYRPVFLDENGLFVSNVGDHANIEKPDSLYSGMYRMAQLVDDASNNPFIDMNLGKEQKEAILTNLLKAQQLVAVSSTDSAPLSDIEVVQMRSSLATVTLSFMEAFSENTDLFEQAFMSYKQVLNAETNPVLKDSMIWNLVASQSMLPRSAKAQINDLKTKIAPTQPPYEEWFKDGNEILNVSLSAGAGDNFMPGAQNMLRGSGFVENTDLSSGDELVFTKEINGMPVNVFLSENDNSIFQNMDKEEMHVTAYMGHSSFGRNTADALNYAPESSDKKLIFLGQCNGKNVLHSVRDKYADSQLVTTFTSSYFRFSEDRNGQKIPSWSEDFNALKVLIDGISKRADWEEMHNGLVSKVTGKDPKHVMNENANYGEYSNYITPMNTLIRRRLLDSDYDGQADILDKLVDFDIQKVTEETFREFNALSPSREKDNIDGMRTHIATQGLNTMLTYNPLTKDLKDDRVINDGYYSPEVPLSRRVVRFQEAKLPGSNKVYYKMQVNENFSHMSVEALRAVAGFQFVMDFGKDLDSRISPVDLKLNALFMAAGLLKSDLGYYDRREEVWANLLDSVNIPDDLVFTFATGELNRRGVHDYSGNKEMVKAWKKELSQNYPETLLALEDSEVGFPKDS